MDTIVLSAFSVYVIFFGAVTYFFHQKNKGTETFLLGNRSLNYVTTALVAHASDMSLWLFMGFPGLVYLTGTAALWVPYGLLFGMWATWSIIAYPLRVETERYNSVTLSDYLTKKFSDTSGNIRLFSSIAAFLFFTVYISSGLVGIAFVLQNLFGIDYVIGALIGLFTTICYTYYGGFMGIAWCHAIQGIFLLFMLFFVPLYAYTFLENGWHDISLIGQLKQISFSLMPHDWDELYTGVTLAIGWGLGYFGQPHILVSFMGINASKDMKKAQYVGMLWQLIILTGAFLIGVVGIGLFAYGLPNPELVFIAMITNLFSPFMAGIIVAAIIAAGLTTINTQILVTASTISEDLYKQYINKKATSAQLMTISKLAIILVPLLSFVIAVTQKSSVLTLVYFAWSGLGCTFGPLLLMGLLQKKLHPVVAFAGMFTGTSIVCIWSLIGYTLPSMIPGFLGSIAVMLIGNFFFPAKSSKFLSTEETL